MQRFMDSTRGRIVGLLRCNPLTVEELASALDLTDNAVRAHLATLERDGLVRTAGVRRREGRGKPAVVYELPRDTDVVLSRAYPLVLNAVLEQVAERLGKVGLAELLQRVGRALAGAPAGGRSGAIDERIALAAGTLEALGGAVTIERREGRTIIRGCGCPLAAAVAERPETCGAVEALLSEVIGAPVRQCCRHGERPSCCFEVP